TSHPAGPMSDSTTPRTPKFRRRAEARPDEVLDAALDLFIEKGVSSTRVDDIARRAGISKGAVYLYFPSKEALLEGLLRRPEVPIAAEALQFAGSYDGDPRLVMTMAMKFVARKLAEPRLLAIPNIAMR